MSEWFFPEQIEGYGSEVSSKALYDEAAKVSEEGFIVELGAYKGQGTVVLALPGRPVIAVDSFMGEWDLNVRWAHNDHLFGGYYQALEKNLETVRLTVPLGPVTVVAGNAEEFQPEAMARINGGQALELLVVDAAHNFESVVKQLEAWEPHVAGRILFDDWQAIPDIARAANQVLPGRGWYPAAEYDEGRLVAWSKEEPDEEAS